MDSTLKIIGRSSSSLVIRLEHKDRHHDYNPKQRYGRYRGERHGRYREDRRWERRSVQRKDLKPMPLGDKCNPLCPFFRCGKNALVIVNRVVKGHVQKAAMCRWIGDQCLGAKCQFAYCERKALLPDGRCAFAVKFKDSGDAFMKELEQSEVDNKVRNLLSRKVGRKESLLE